MLAIKLNLCDTVFVEQRKARVMLVSELITLLSKCDQNVNVYVEAYDKTKKVDTSYGGQITQVKRLNEGDDSISICCDLYY